jgi:hypothetical protein
LDWPKADDPFGSFPPETDWLPPSSFFSFPLHPSIQAIFPLLPVFRILFSFSDFFVIRHARAGGHPEI